MEIGNEIWNKKKKKKGKIIKLGEKSATVQNELGSPYQVSYVQMEHLQNHMNRVIRENRGKEIPMTKIDIEWKPIQSKQFPDWIESTFSMYQLTKENKETMQQVNKTKGFRPFKHQQFLRDYLQNKSPYRGLLLYHGLGSGKTCTSLTIAEGLRKSGKTVIIMLPASLRNDFYQDGLLFCADPDFQREPEKVEKYYSFVSYNAANKLEQLRALGSLDDRVIIIEEAHNFISQVANGSYHAREMYDQLMRAKHTKIIALTGTPLINEVYELALLMNILRGPMEVHRFGLGVVGRDFLVKQYVWQEEVLKDPMVETIYVDLLQKVVEVQVRIPMYDRELEEWKRKFVGDAGNVGIPLRYIGSDSYRLFPDDRDGETFQEEFMKIREDGTIYLKNESMFQRRLQGLVSYYTPDLKEAYPRVVQHPRVEVEMSDYQFILYEMIRAIEKAAEKVGASASSKKKKLSENKSYFRIFSRQFGNFVFPEEIVRPFKRVKLQDAYHQTIFRILHPEEAKRKEEEEKDRMSLTLSKNDLRDVENEKLSVEYLGRVVDAVQQLHQNASKYLKDQLGKYSPKFKACLERIERSPGLVFIYSQFKTLEGLQVMGEVLRANGYEFFDVQKLSQQDITNWNFTKKKRYAMYTGEEDYGVRSKLKQIFRDPRNKYGDYLQVLMATSAGAEGLDLKNIRQVHILEPYWNTVRKKQVVGRAIRLNSHRELPEKDRSVDIYEYCIVFSSKQRKETKEKNTSDEYILEISKKKEEITDRVLQMLKEVAVDCRLNFEHHDGSFVCIGYDDMDGFAYLPSIYRDFVYQSTEKSGRKKVVEKKQIYLGGLDEGGRIWIGDRDTGKYYMGQHYQSRLKPVDPTKVNIIEKVGVEIETGVVYRWESVKTAYPVRIGKMNEESQLIRD